MFSHITENWRGRPLVSHEVITNLIANTKTRTGLRIRAELDLGKYPTGIKVTDADSMPESQASAVYGIGTRIREKIMVSY